jgi:hypothetical protein
VPSTSARNEASDGSSDSGSHDVVAEGLDHVRAAAPNRCGQRGVLGVLAVEDQGLLAAEVLEQRRRGHVGCLGDVADADLVVPVRQEEPQGGVGD